MADIKLTPAQQQVVDARDCSLLVAAAAGSGKTAVLVRRIIDRIRSGQTSLDRLIIVTFTNAAAAEMKERIGKALREEADKNPEVKRFKEQLALLSEAKISTIDSFCNSIVRENFQALGIDPGFSIMEPVENELIMADVLEELFEEEYEKQSEDFMTLVSSYGAYKDDDGVKKLVIDLARFADNEPRPTEWLENCISDFDKAEHPELVKNILFEYKRVLKDILKLCEHCIELCEAESGLPSATKNFIADREMLKELLENSGDFDTAVRGINAASLGRFSAATKLSDEEAILKDKVMNIRNGYKKALKDVRDTYFFDTLEKAEETYAKTRPAVSALVRITLEFMKRVDETKREKSSFSFSDIEHMAFRILCERDKDGNEGPTAVARELAKGFDEIMIDEYQDSSYIQEYMLKSISGEYGEGIPNLFMVGDVKQSIYSFRQARPELFQKKYDYFKDAGAHRKIDLSENFRSRKSVLDAVNVLLAPVMKKDMTEIEYDGAAALHFGSTVYTEDDPKNPVYNTEVILIDRELSDGTEEDETDEEEPEESIAEGRPNDIEREALTVAKKIREMIDSGFLVSDGKTEAGEKKTRPVRPGDFAVLTRNGKQTTEIFVKQLSKLRLPAVAETGTGFFAAVEIRKTLAFLRILDNPYDDISFAAALYSPYAEFTASDLAELKIRYGKTQKQGKKKLLYECLLTAMEDEEANDALSVKIREFMEILFSMRALNETLTVHELIKAFYKITNYKNTVTSQPGGENRRGNLDLLVMIAEKYEKSSFAGLHDFIRYIDRLNENNSDFGEADTEGTGDAVKVTTMHRSKGLEYPIVFVCRLSKEFNQRSSRENVMLDRELGIGSNFVDRKKRIKSKTLKQVFLQKRERQKSLSEELRILYVALTRAKEKLFIVASEKKPAEAMKKWNNTLIVNESPTYLDLKGSKSFMDFVGATLFSGLFAADIEELDEGKEKNITVTRHAGKEKYAAGFGLRLVRYDEKSAKELAEQTPAGKTERFKKVTVRSFTDAPGVREEIRAQSEFVYPGEEKAKAPMRVSVSALKHIEIENLMKREEREEEFTPLLKGMPDESGKDGVSAGAARGTLYHEVFEKLRYEGDYSSKEKAKQSVREDIEGLIAEQFLEKDITKTVSVNDIAEFCMSGIGKRMIGACKKGKLRREQPFVYGLSPEEYRHYSKTEEETDMVMVQGIIDAYIDDEDGITLVDYKTDKVYGNAAEELVTKYRVQLELYAKALERITGKKVKEKVIYSVSAGIDIYL